MCIRDSVTGQVVYSSVVYSSGTSVTPRPRPRSATRELEPLRSEASVLRIPPGLAGQPRLRASPRAEVRGCLRPRDCMTALYRPWGSETRIRSRGGAVVPVSYTHL